MLTLTNCPDDWQTLRGQVRDMRRRMVKAGLACEWIWTVERGAKTGMKHVHLIQRGAYLPQAHLQSLWGERIVHIMAVHDAAKYISKSAGMVAGYISKGASGGNPGLATHLGLNGGRLHHWSRGFFEGRSIREAVAASHGASRDEQWITVFAPGQLRDEVLARGRAAVSCAYRPGQLDARATSP